MEKQKKRQARTKNKEEGENTSPLRQCRFEAYEMMNIRRDQIKNAPYNPRSISETAKKKLRKALDKEKGGFGLVMPLVWNIRSGNLVGGHQRLKQLDALEGSFEYMLQVSVVDLDDKAEKELNILLNNDDVQGVFELDLLKDMAGDIDFEKAGLEFADMFKLFGDTALDGKQEEELADLSNKMHESIEMFDKLEKKSNDKNDTYFYAVVVFKDSEEREKFCELVEVDESIYIDGRGLRGLIEELKEKAGAVGGNPGVV